MTETNNPTGIPTDDSTKANVCPMCGKKAAFHETIPRHKIVWRGARVEIENAKILRCHECGEKTISAKEITRWGEVARQHRARSGDEWLKLLKLPEDARIWLYLQSANLPSSPDYNKEALFRIVSNSTEFTVVGMTPDNLDDLANFCHSFAKAMREGKI